MLMIVVLVVIAGVAWDNHSKVEKLENRVKELELYLNLESPQEITL